VGGAGLKAGTLSLRGVATMTHADELARQQKIRHIMTPVEQFHWLRPDEPCTQAKERLAGYSYAPLQGDGRVVLLELDGLPDAPTPVREARARPIVDELQAEDELWRAPEWFEVHDIYLVRDLTPVVGLVHLSDLNRLAFRACLYHQIAALEAALLDHVERFRPDEAQWGSLLGEDQLKRAREQHAKSRHNKVDLRLIAELYIGDLVDLCCPELAEVVGCEEARYRDRVTAPIRGLRSRVMHVGKPVLRRRSGLRDLAGTLRMIAQLRGALAAHRNR
jgi:hypothetical protein